MSAPVLLLHGQPGSARDWDRVLAKLGARTAIVPDRPGWSPARRRATDLDGNARAAIAELDARGISEPVIVAGHSFGGAVAAWLAARFPDRVAGLVLAAPSANPASLNVFDRLLAAPVAGEVLSGSLLGGAGWALRIRRLRQLLSDDEGYLEAAGRRLRSPSAWTAFVVEQRALISDLPVLERDLSEIEVPVRILAGTADVIVPLTSLRALAAAIPSAELELINRAGHLLPMRRPGELAAAIDDLSR